MRRLTLVLALVAMACGVLLAPAGAPAAKSKNPTVTSVSPMRVKAGASLSLRGRNFSRNPRRNTVIFSVGRRSIFAKPSRASSRRLVVKVPVSLERLMRVSDSSLAPTRFTLKVATNRRFSRKTSRRLSPVVVPLSSRRITPPAAPPSPSGGGSTGGGPAAPPPPPPPPPDCDKDGILNSADTSSDTDLIADALERTLRTDPCKADTDGDGVQDGFEYRSAIDLNDDEYQDPNNSLPYPSKRPYPNPLDPSDGNVDYDGDVLTQREEQALWNLTVSDGAARRLSPVGNEVTGLTYSDGEQYSRAIHPAGAGDRVQPSIAATGYDKQQSFLNWAGGANYNPVLLSDGPWFYVDPSDPVTTDTYDLRDANRSGNVDPGRPAGYHYREATYYDFDVDGWLSDNERDEDADGLTNYDESHGRMTAAYWTSCYDEEDPYRIGYQGTNLLDTDTDGDNVRDGADDQDHDDIPNVMELSRNAASGLDDEDPAAFCKPRQGLPSPPDTHHPDAYGRVNPMNPCLPAVWSRTCERHPTEATGAPFDGSLHWLSLN